MQNNVTARQKDQCAFHGTPRERDRTTVENLSGVTAGSLMVGTPIIFQ